ncbi:MAG: hypothetical protein WAL91_00530, partial [Propionicimonas sp.]
RQLHQLGLSRAEVTAHLDAERWLAIGEKVVLLQNATPVRRQLIWAAVLDAGRCALGSHTSLELAGFRGFAAEATSIHLVIPRGHKVTPLAGVVVHESRRLQVAGLITTDGLPRTPTARSVLDAGAWQPSPRFAAIMVAAAVQQRVVTPAQLESALRTVGRIRHKQFLREAVRDASVGAHAGGELELARMCRRFGLVAPARQSQRRDPSGVTRYLDAEWDVPGGTVVLEVDGKHHLDAASWQADMRRERAIVVSRTWVLRATNHELRHDPASLVSDLHALGVPYLSELSEAGGAIAL